MQKEQYVPTGKGLIALSPLMVFLMMYVGLSIFVGDFYTVPLSVAFVLSSVWGVATTARLPLSERLKVFSRGAANSDVITLIVRSSFRILVCVFPSDTWYHLSWTRLRFISFFCAHLM